MTAILSRAAAPAVRPRACRAPATRARRASIARASTAPREGHPLPKNENENETSRETSADEQAALGENDGDPATVGDLGSGGDAPVSEYDDWFGDLDVESRDMEIPDEHRVGKRGWL